MLSIKDLHRKEKEGKEGIDKKTIPVGSYHSTVLSVAEPEEYAPGERIVIQYELTNSHGEKFKFQEVFQLRCPSERTYEFAEYLAKSGIYEFEDFVGCEEEVDIRLRKGRRKAFPSIIAREMLGILTEE